MSRGSPGTPPHTPGHGLPVSWHAVVPDYPFGGRVSHRIQRHLLSSLPAARAIHQCASRRTDYYDPSVAIELASLRRSHVRHCCTSERDVGGPLISFNTLAGHRPVPRRVARSAAIPGAGHGAGSRRLSGGREVPSTGDWASGNPAFAISRGPSHGTVPNAWTRPVVCWHALVPATPFGCG